MPALPQLPLARLGVVTLTELRAAGWTESAVRHALRQERLIRIASGRFAPPPADTLNRFRRADLALAQRAVAATLGGDRVAVSHLAAAYVRGWPVWAEHPAPCVATWDPRVCRVSGVHLHRVPDLGPIVRSGGLAATSADRTVVDIAREFGTGAGLVSGDAALRHRRITRASLAAEITACSGLRCIERARPLPVLLDPLAESPLESRSRWCIHQHGITMPDSQVWIYRVDGSFVARVDHFWAEGVVGEADGRLKYENDPDALPEEKKRQQAVEDLDLEVARWGAGDLRDFTPAAQRIARARHRARRKGLDAPPLWRAFRRDGTQVHRSVVDPA